MEENKTKVQDEQPDEAIVFKKDTKKEERDRWKSAILLDADNWWPPERNREDRRMHVESNKHMLYYHKNTSYTIYFLLNVNLALYISCLY